MIGAQQEKLVEMFWKQKIWPEKKDIFSDDRIEPCLGSFLLKALRAIDLNKPAATRITTTRADFQQNKTRGNASYKLTLFHFAMVSFILFKSILQ